MRRDVLLTVVLVVTFVAVLLGGCGVGPLSASDPAEIVLRSVRLAGFEGTVTGEESDIAWVWMHMPGVDSAVDIEIALETGFATLAVAYPDADRYRVSVAVMDEPMLEAEADAKVVRTAVDGDDSSALHASSDFTYLPEYLSSQLGESSLSAGADVSESYLDAKNRAASVHGTQEDPVEKAFERLESARSTLLSTADGRPAFSAEDGAESFAREILSGLDGSARGEEVISARVEAIAQAGGSLSAEQYVSLREMAMLVEVVTGEIDDSGLLAPIASLARFVESSELEPGPMSDAVLVAAQDEDAPANASEVTMFERVASLDVISDATTGSLARSALEVDDGTWVEVSGEVRRFSEQEWLAYRRADGTLYWLGTVESQLALVSESVEGWAFSRSAVAVVDSSDVGTRLGSIRLPGFVYQDEE